MQVKQGKAGVCCLVVFLKVETVLLDLGVHSGVITEQDGAAEDDSSLHNPLLTVLSEPPQFSTGSSCMTSSLTRLVLVKSTILISF